MGLENYIKVIYPEVQTIKTDKYIEVSAKLVEPIECWRFRVDFKDYGTELETRAAIGRMYASIHAAMSKSLTEREEAYRIAEFLKDPSDSYEEDMSQTDILTLIKELEEEGEQ